MVVPDAVVSSAIVRASAVVLAVGTLVALVGTACGRCGRLTDQQRFTRYIQFYMQRHAEWAGLEEKVSSSRLRLTEAVLRDHSLLRLIFPPKWTPHAPLSAGRRLLIALALLQTSGLVCIAFFVPPVQKELAFDGGLPTLMAAGACMLCHLFVRSMLERLHARRARLLFRRPDERGRTEGHVVARAALAHFDTAHTLRSVLRSWWRVAWELERLGGTFRRLAYGNVLLQWWRVCEEMGVEQAAQRLRAQRLQAWSLLDAEWLRRYSADVSVHTRPLVSQLRLAMPLDDALVDSFSVAVHQRLEPTISERMLEQPPVGRVRFLLGARWALATWVETLRQISTDLEARRATRTSVTARRTAAAARRAAAVLGWHWGFRQWTETMTALHAQEEAQTRITDAMGAFGKHKACSDRSGDSSDNDDDDDADADADANADTLPGLLTALSPHAHEGVLASFSKRKQPQPGSFRQGGTARSSARSHSSAGGFEPEYGCTTAGEGGTDAPSHANADAAAGTAVRTWDGISALDPEAMFDDPTRLEAIRQRVLAAHPPPLPREALTRQLTTTLLHPVGNTLLSVARVRSVQVGASPPLYGPMHARSVLKRGELTPRAAGIAHQKVSHCARPH